MKKTNLSFFMALAMISSLFFSCRDPSGETTNNVTITLDANGGEASDGKTSVTMTAPEGTRINLVDNIFSRTGYTYLGWAKDKDSVTIDYADKAEIEFNTDFTLYAIWSKDTLGGVPTEVKASTLNSKPAISWKGVTAATKYIVYINVKNDSASATEAANLDEENIGIAIRTNTLTVENDVYTYEVFLQNGNGNYYFWVKAANDDETSDFSSVVKVTKGTLEAPKAPTVAQSSDTKNKITVSIEKEDGKYYRLYESTTNDFSKASMKSYTLGKKQDFTVSEAGTYYYWITAADMPYKSNAESDPSEAVSVSFTRDELKTPTETSATLGTDNKTVTVNWTKADTKKPGKFLLYYLYDEGKIIETPSIKNATLIVLDGASTSKKIENLGKGYFHWWILEADDDPTIYANTEKSTVNEIPNNAYF